MSGESNERESSRREAIAAERPYLMRYAFRQLRNREQAEDAVQSALADAFEHAAGFGARSALRTWLFAILRNRIADQKRRAQRDALFADAVVANVGGPDIAACDPQAAADARQRLRATDAALGRIPPRHAQAILLKALVARPTAAARALLGVNASQYWMLVHRARRQLRSLVPI